MQTVCGVDLDVWHSQQYTAEKRQCATVISMMETQTECGKTETPHKAKRDTTQDRDRHHTRYHMRQTPHKPSTSVSRNWHSNHMTNIQQCEQNVARQRHHTRQRETPHKTDTTQDRHHTRQTPHKTDTIQDRHHTRQRQTPHKTETDTTQDRGRHHTRHRQTPHKTERDTTQDRGRHHTRQRETSHKTDADTTQDRGRHHTRQRHHTNRQPLCPETDTLTTWPTYSNMKQLAHLYF